MKCSYNDLRKKEVIDIDNGEKLGFVDDIEIDTETSRVLSMTIYGHTGFFGLWSKESDIIIKCSEIKVIGKETMLISFKNSPCKANENHLTNTNATKSKRFLYKTLSI